MRRALRRPNFVVGAFMVLVIIFVGALAPSIAPYDPDRLNVRERLAPPSVKHPFGTDHFGRDLLSRVLFGARTSLAVGGIVAITSLAAGAVIGCLAGYFGGMTDLIVMRIMDAWMVFPAMLLAMALLAAFGPTAANVVLALSIVYTPRTARVVRAAVLRTRDETYVEAARAIGCSPTRVLRKTIIPNVRSQMVVQASFTFAYAVLVEAALTFLGVGAPPEVQSLGALLDQGRPYLRQAPWYMLFPGLTATWTIVGLNLLGDGLRDTWDPKLTDA